jgi:hypothetical protein
MAGSLSYGSARYFTNDNRLVNKEFTIIPASSITRIPPLLCKEDKPQVHMTAIHPNPKEQNWVRYQLSKNDNPKAAPKALPDNTPKTPGDTMGFLYMDCNATPDTESDAPHSTAAITRGSLICRIIFFSMEERASESPDKNFRIL